MTRVQLPSIEIILDVLQNDAVEDEPAVADPRAPKEPTATSDRGLRARTGQAGTRPSPRPVTWGEYWAVTRLVHLPPGALAWFRFAPTGTAVEVARRPRRLLRMDGGCRPSRRGQLEGWRRSARIVVHGWCLVRFVRVDIELVPWSPWDAELRLVPRSLRLSRWGLWRRRRYFDMAHDAGDALRDALASERDGAGHTTGR